MARKYAGYKRISIRVTGDGGISRYGIELLSGNGRVLMRTRRLDGHDKDSINAIARRLGDSFRPACTVRMTLAK